MTPEQQQALANLLYAEKRLERFESAADNRGFKSRMETLVRYEDYYTKCCEAFEKAFGMKVKDLPRPTAFL